MYDLGDTIAAISTPVGQGGIGIVRTSGPQSIPIASRIFIPQGRRDISHIKSHTISYGHVIDPSDDDSIVDEVLVSVMRAPHSYTKEDIVEINCHGGMVSVRKIMELLLSHGARLAEPGEFTKRAFLNGRINLSQAEAVLDLIQAKTDESMKLAMQQLKGGLSEKFVQTRDMLLEIAAMAEAYIDFPEEEIEVKTAEETKSRLHEILKEIEQLTRTFDEARFFREGLSVAIVGKPNAGKSSLLNALLKKDKAIVTELPGTTRDLIEDYLNIQGLPIRIIDTAGLRKSDETVEKEGIRRTLDAIENADFVIAMFDGSEPETAEDRELLQRLSDKNAVLAVNKSDLPRKISDTFLSKLAKPFLLLSALKGEGIEELKGIIFESNLKNWKEDREGIVITNIRHKQALGKASAALDRALIALTENKPLEIFSIEIREALDSIGEVTGSVTSDDILNRIFSNFCIGK